ncbi:SpaA isopeptide-forming pilin-related protein [Lentilactobacillus senioris]|uniref:SpaA isopeptide-forming pilin-related protein n=1 Tax=Lentilactobacillus senioris TaxID=931534 RepID=UPI003D290E46
MNLKKLFRFIALVTVMIGTITLGCSLAKANTKTPDNDGKSLNFKIWKTENSTGNNNVIENTGDSIGIGEYPNGITAYDVKKNGTVTYTVYDITSLFNKLGVSLDDYNTAKYVTVRDQLIQDILNGATAPEDVLAAQDKFVKDNNLNDVKNASAVVDGGQGQTKAFGQFNKKGYYLVMETGVENITNFAKLSAPLIVPSSQLSQKNNSTIHLYPKNVVQPSKTSIDFTKNGENPENVSVNIPIGGVKFSLIDSNGITQTVTTDNDGKLNLTDLEPNKTYKLVETEAAPGYELPSADNVYLEFQVSDTGIIRVIGNPTPGYFTISENAESVDMNNFLIKGGANFVKIDSEKNDKGETVFLEGAEFKLSKVKGNTTLWAQFDNENKFLAWKTNKEDGTPLVSKANGEFGFTGVPYEADKKDDTDEIKTQYQLVETKAPTGYELLQNPINIEINKDTEKAKEKEIENSKNSLPMTGGMGIWLFVIAGLALMGGSGYLYYKKQRI